MGGFVKQCFDVSFSVGHPDKNCVKEIKEET